MMWSETRAAQQGERRWHLWAELIDESGQPIRRSNAKVTEANSYVVAAFGRSKEDAEAKIERGKPSVEASRLLDISK